MWQTEWSTAATKPIVISAWLDADRSINSSIIVIREREKERGGERVGDTYKHVLQRTLGQPTVQENWYE